jgi:hypothetical protein
MNNKIKVQIYGIENQILGGGRMTGGCGGCSAKSGAESKGCGNSEGKEHHSCNGGCGSSGGCGSKTPKTIIEAYRELVTFIEISELKEYVDLEFLDIRKIDLLDNDNIRMLYDRDFELPYCVVDGIIRYYGGISNSLIYKDIKELISE